MLARFEQFSYCVKLSPDIYTSCDFAANFPCVGEAIPTTRPVRKLVAFEDTN